MPTFKELGVRDDLLRAIEMMGYEKPMPIQEMVIPHLLNEETDVVGLAQTGTGKTAAFGLPTLQRIDTSSTATHLRTTRATSTGSRCWQCMAEQASSRKSRR